MQRGQIERREFEYKRHGTVTFLVSLNVYDGQMWGCCLEANDHEHFPWGVQQLERRYPRARRLHLIDEILLLARDLIHRHPLRGLDAIHEEITFAAADQRLVRLHDLLLQRVS